MKLSNDQRDIMDWEEGLQSLLYRIFVTGEILFTPTIATTINLWSQEIERLSFNLKNDDDIPF